MKSITFAAIVTISAAQHFATEHGKAPPAVTCPAGYTLMGKKCEQIITAAPQAVCATGILLGDMCTNYAGTIKQCPIGTSQIGADQCAVNRLQPAASSCPEGFSDGGQAGCVAAKPLPLVAVCEVGAMDASGECLLVETAPKITKSFCPAGFQDLGKGCEQSVEYDCSPPVVDGKALPPPPPPVLPIFPYQKHNKHRMLGSRKFSVYAPRIIPALPVPPPSKAAIPLPPPPPPAPKVAVVRQTCVRKDFAPPLTEAYCPPGFTEVGKKCVAKKSFPPVQKCSNGLAAQDCVEHLNAARQWFCNEGTLIGEQCQTQVFVPIEIVCPAGTHLIGEQCASYTKPTFVCPPTMQQEAGMCIGKNTAEPTGIVTVQCTGKNCWQGHNKYY